MDFTFAGNDPGGGIAHARPSSAPPDHVSVTSLPTNPSLRAQFKARVITPLKSRFSRNKGLVAVPMPSAPEGTPDSISEAPSTSAPPKLISEVQTVTFQKDLVDPAQEIAMYDNAILVVDLFQKGVKLTELVLPNPVSDILESLVKVLGVLKQMVENKEAWKGILNSLVDHHKRFNAQIIRLKKENTTVEHGSPLLEPLGCYAEALKKLTANAIADSGIFQETGLASSVTEKIKLFVHQYTEAGSEPAKIQKYHEELVTAMRQLMQDHIMYTAFAVERMELKLDKALAEGAVPKPRINITAKRAPAVTQFYVPRDVERAYMANCLVNPYIPGRKIFVITGMGGCGKTQLVSDFLNENKNMFTHLVYVDASTTASIQTDLQRWAQSLGAGHEEDDWNKAIDLLSDGPDDVRWAYVLDNADDQRLDLAPFLPGSGSGIVIITSRNKAAGELATVDPLELGEMNKKEALTTLLNAARRKLPTISPEELDNARGLTNELGCLPVALVHAGAYCHRMSSNRQGVRQTFTFLQYRDLFRSSRADLMRRKGPPTLDDYTRLVYTTLDVSYDVLSPASMGFLQLASNFHYSDVPVAMLETAAKRSFHDPENLLPRPRVHEAIISQLNAVLCVDGSWADVHIHKVIENLQSLSLVSTTFVDDAMFLQFHPLVQAWARDEPPSVTEKYRPMATQVVTSCCTEEHVGLYRYLLPHILEILADVPRHTLHVNDRIAFVRVLGDIVRYQHAEALLKEALESLRRSSPDETEETILLTSCLARLYHHQGQNADAEKLELEVLENFTSILGTDHPRTITSTSALASTYNQQGRYKEAEELELDVLEKRTRILGPEHPDTLSAASNLAATYSVQGRLEEAKELQLDVLEKLTRILGPEHPHTLSAASNLAATYSVQGRLEEAGKLRLDVLEKRTRILGPEHPDTLSAASNLAITYSVQGRLEEAGKLRLDVLEKRTRILGPEHPDTLTGASNLANTYSVQGRLEEAGKLQLDVLEKLTRILGPEHPDTLSAANNLANTYSVQGRLEEAKELQLDVLEKRTRILGPEHPDTLTGASNLANTYSVQGQLEEAKELRLDVLEKLTRILGPEHPHTLSAASNLANTYSVQGRLEEARILRLDVLEKRTRILGPEHPDTLSAANNLAATYSVQGRLEEAKELQLDVLEKRTRILGPEHPDTLSAASNLANTYSVQGRLEEARKLRLDVLEKRTRILGPEHPDTLTGANNLANTYSVQGQLEEARELQLDVLEKLTRILGPEHPHTLSAANNLANTYSVQGQLEEAKELQLDVLEKLTRILGPEHPDTLSAANNLANTYSVQGRLEEAKKLRLDVLEKRTRILGPEHPDTLSAANNLANTYSVQGRLEEAKKLRLDVLEKRTRILGPEHPDTLSAANNISNTYSKQGRWKEAQNVRQRKWAGVEYTDGVKAADNSAASCRVEGKKEESRDPEKDAASE